MLPDEEIDMKKSQYYQAQRERNNLKLTVEYFSQTLRAGLVAEVERRS
jgi:hypothetical protein